MARVTGIDVMMLYGESAGWHMHVCALTILDPSTAPERFDADALWAVFKERLVLAPQFRWKVRDVAFGLDQPAFVEDEHFELQHHLHRAALPRPGGERELGELAGQLMARRLERSRPLWEMWLIEGLDGGRFALLTKIHHAVVDGTSGVDLGQLLMDVEPVPAPRDGPPAATTGPPPSALVSAAGAIGNALWSPVRMARYAAQIAEQAVVMGRHLLRGTAAGLPFATPRSALNGAITQRRELAFTSVPLADAIRVQRAFKVKVNDVVLALVADALRSWLEGLGSLPDRSLVAEVPRSVRTTATRHDVGTRVANTFVSLATDVTDPAARLLAIHRSSQDAKALQHDLAAHKQVNLSDVPPPRLLGAAVRGFAGSGLESLVPPIFSLIVSSVAGPTVDFYMAGAKVVGTYPMGPLLYGSGLNVTALTLGDRIHFGLVACPDVVPDAWPIAERLPGALADLVALCPPAGRPVVRRSSRRSTKTEREDLRLS
jgi:WS/DGAT/MGAT family acyltransferase